MLRISSRWLLRSLSTSPKTTAASTIIEGTDDNFKNVVLKNDKLVIVDFYANWCQPCKLMGPSLEQLSKEYSSKISIVKVNVDDHLNVSSQYEISALPTLMAFNQGKKVDSLLGYQEITKLKQWIQQHLPSS